MTRKLQFLMTFLLLLGGTNFAWADDNWTLDADVFFRTSLSNNTYSWNSGYPKTAETVGDGNMAGNHRVGMFVLQKYSVNDLKAAKSITLKIKRVTSGGGDALGIWAFSTNEWSTESKAPDLAAIVNTIVGLDLNTTGTPSNTPLVNGTSTITDDVCSFVISGDALKTLKDNATYDGTKGTFTLLITNKTENMNSDSSSDRKFYGSGNTTEAYRPTIEIEYCPVAIDNTPYETLDAAVTEATEGQTISIYDDTEISTNISFDKNLTIVPAKTGLTINISTNISGNYNVFGLATENKTVQIGCEDYLLTIDGQNTTLGDRKLVEVSNGRINLTNVFIKDVSTTSIQGVICGKASGYVKLKDVSFNGCQATATNAGIVFCGANDHIILSGNNQFIGCVGYDIHLERRFTIDETNGITNNNPISVFVETGNIKLGNPVATKANNEDVTRFVIKNTGYGLYKKDGGSRNDLLCCEGYPLEITSACAATLMLPYDSSIPTGVTCYTLSYTSGNDITATEVTGGTLSANTPVLVKADAGLYYMLNSTKATTATSYTSTNTYSSGVLTGVYQETTVTAGYYILTNHSGNVGFRKVKEGYTNKVQPNRAYMSVTYSPGTIAHEFFGINFGGETTGIDNLNVNANDNFDANAPMYNLAGQRVGSNYKGVVIQNGKKYIKK